MSLHRADTRALVAGGTGRLGGAIAARFEHVVAAGRSDGDLATAEGARALVATAVERLGGLDVVVHAAGDGFAAKPFDEVTEADWDTALDVTAKGTFFLAQAAAPALRESRGVLIVLEDVAAYQAWPAYAAHCAAKAAQAMVTRVLAKALAPDVRVCGIVPGPVAVDPGDEPRRAATTLLGRVGSADDIADAVVYLAGAGYVTGTTLVVDGGQLAKSGARGAP